MTIVVLEDFNRSQLTILHIFFINWKNFIIVHVKVATDATIAYYGDLNMRLFSKCLVHWHAKEIPLSMVLVSL